MQGNFYMRSLRQLLFLVYYSAFPGVKKNLRQFCQAGAERKVQGQKFEFTENSKLL
jgi:hypothetical protein